MVCIRSKSWVFTLNNYTEDELDELCSLFHEEHANYVILGLEKGQEGTEHVQGYIELLEKVSLVAFKRLPGMERVHCEIRRGTAMEASTYCKKDDNFLELGNLQMPGRRTDLEAIRERIANGATALEIAESDFGKWCQYGKRFESYRALLNGKPRDFKSMVHVYTGATGTGKTRKVYEENENVYPVSVPTTKGGAVWFDGYMGHDNVLIDDYRGEYEFSFLLRLLDRYPMQVPVKGDFVNWRPKKIFITSNHPPREWYPMLSDEDFAPLQRRLDQLEEF